MTQRFTVRTDKIPAQLRERFFYAWIHDANHPDDPKDGASISWHQSIDDAMTVCEMLNAADRMKKAVRRLADDRVDGDGDPVEGKADE